eukprot:1480116-Ditylum_brightwellii.AAC.1
MQRSRDAAFKWAVHSSDVSLFLGASFVGFSAPRPPCLTGSAARFGRSCGTLGILKRAGRRRL